MTTNPYDELPYPSLVYTDTHPNRLATLAKLFGLNPSPVATSRVLELGCGDGTNLIAIAQTLPQAHCYGIDASAKQIAQGQQIIKTLGLTNITLQPLHFEELAESLGTFDYIIAHGVYSWIPIDLQEILFNRCQHHLSPHGIAYFSYNIYPGWHLDNVVRELMLYHLQQLPADLPLAIKMKQAKGIWQFLTQLRHGGHSAFDVLLQEKSQQLQSLSDNYLCHDWLEQDNHPVYFQQFVQQATQSGFTYVTDIEFRHYLLLSFPAEVVEAMTELFQGDFFKREQYLDFFYNRTLRRSLLCHQTLPVQREIQTEVIRDCYLSTALSISAEADSIQTADGEDFSLKHPVIKTTLLHLSQVYPHRLSFTELFKQVYPNVAPTEVEPLQHRFLQILSKLYYQQVIELDLTPPAFITTLSPRPLASPLARWQASQGQTPLINLRCELVELNPLCLQLLPYLNGQQDNKRLITILTKIVKAMKIRPPNNKIDYQAILTEALQNIAHSALLMA